MKILGISASHDAGAALIGDGKIIAAINEERLVREKLYWGFPEQSVKKVLEISDTKPGDIGYIFVAGITSGAGPTLTRPGDFRCVSRKRKFVYLISILGITKTKMFKDGVGFIFSRFRKEEEHQKILVPLGIEAEVMHVDHHYVHAASAFYTSPFDKGTLVLTTDGAGDGNCSIIFTVNEDYEMEKRSDIFFYHSPAETYAYVTYNLGFRTGRHGGKITGLAAYGNQEKIYPIFKRLIQFDSKKLRYCSNIGCWGAPAAMKLHKYMRGYKREDIAAGVQQRVEEVSSQYVKAAIGKYNCNNVALAGGLFANVKVNQGIAEVPSVDRIFIHPHMGDGGLAVGVALNCWAELMLDKGKKPKQHPVDNVYFGQGFSTEEIEKHLQDSGLNYKYHEDIKSEVAQLVADKKIVGRLNGQMEYGPRALGNRSILADPTDTSINDWLNKRLRRTEFMHFAPFVIHEHVEEFYKNFDAGEIAAKFMTITFDVTEEGVKRAPAVVHIDNAARPQTVTREQNESYYKILKAYYEITGLPISVNTSFNMHEAPIVCTPCDAIMAFKLGSVDVLAIVNYLVGEE